jgi:leucine dehydrogenase
MLQEKGILYAPDYAINSGGITSVGYEYFSRTGRNPYNYPLTMDTMMNHVSRIGDTLKQIYTLAEQKNIGTGDAANQQAERLFMAKRASTATSAA